MTLRYSFIIEIGEHTRDAAEREDGEQVEAPFLYKRQGAIFSLN